MKTLVPDVKGRKHAPLVTEWEQAHPKSSFPPKSIRFSQTIKLLEFPRIGTGSCGIPKVGGHPLGIGGEPDVRELEFEEYELKRSGKRRRYPSSSGASELKRICEKKRKAMLKHWLPDDERSSNVEAKELERIRNLRKEICCEKGCKCDDRDICTCLREGVGCHDEEGNYCGCSSRCKNPEGRYSYNLNAVNSFRMKVLHRLRTSTEWFKLPSKLGARSDQASKNTNAG